VCDIMTQDCGDLTQWQVVAQDIVSMRAIYAISTAAGPQWTRANITTIAQANTVQGIAVAIVARSPLIEKPRGTGGCDATNSASLPDAGQPNAWYQQYMGSTDGTIVNAAFNLSTSRADWQCYRYKLFQTAVPVRNLTWRP